MMVANSTSRALSLARSALRADLLAVASRALPSSSSSVLAPTAVSPSLRSSAQSPPCSRRFSTAPVLAKSKRSFAQSVDEDGGAEDDGDVPVMRTKGKGKAAASSTKGAAKSRKGGKEQAEREDPAKYKTSTKNDELPGEQFDQAQLSENMKRAVERCRATVTQKVGMMGRADPSILDGLKVTIGKGESSVHPLKELATVGVRNGALQIHPFDPSYAKDIEKAIYTSELNLAPQLAAGDEEGMLRVPIPKMTTELRQAMVKDISRICENARVSIRSARHEAQKQIKADIDNKIVGTSEGKAETKKMEDATKKWTTEVDQLFQQMKSKVEASMS